jgi:hypothetical protein
VDDARGMDVFQAALLRVRENVKGGWTDHDLVEEVLDELFFEGSRCEETV